MADIKTIDLDEIKAKLETVVHSMRIYCNGKAPQYGSGMYSILSKKFPLYTDSNVPPAAMANLRAHHTPACADNGHVYFSSEMFKELWEEGLNRTEGPTPNELGGDDVRESITTLLIHEYTHLVMEHWKRLKTFAKRSKNVKNINTYTLACEIEANRGWGMPAYSYTYRIGVTEETFPECKGVFGLTNIYNVLKKRHGDDVDNYANHASGGGGESEEEGEKEEGQKPTSKPSSLSDKQKEALDKLAKQHHAKQLMEQKGDSEEGEEGTSISGGMGDEEEKEYKTSQEAVEAFNKRFMEREMKADLSALKGVISGEDIAISRVKTYSRPARREGENGLMRKGVKKGAHNAPRILIGLDCSGSMDSTSMSDVMSTCASIIRVTGTKMAGSYICTHDTQVSNIRPLHEWESVIRKFYPCGGNSFNRLLMEALKLDVDVVINLGDGFDTIKDTRLLKKAKDKRLKWVDVIVNSDVSKEKLLSYLDSEEEHLGDLRMQRKTLKVK